ncbi:MAG: tricarballylate dehydrogenase [Chloroflexi bacterium]|jgi:tricarballylate dehydrogenase|nr:tricarballylate dehydrogenase [Chloroflexota bacterium]MCH2531749.1 FAD-dependent tricarballylate dehydrogenase TcuA [Dehalococcoidia bacterium]HCH35525.1 tricarballylate dehydrogenase [Dehalococcoidia bacterium]|tara:strand:+ start:1773 stop:3254 length:1482 start_codon:yes stop_codon:yes gene_type:complete
MSNYDADIIIVGAGNAALCAAIAAREQNKSVIVLEKAPEPMRGGNTYFTGGAIRFSYKGIEDVIALVPDLSQAELDVMEVGSYTDAKYFEDLMRVTEGLSDQEMANTLVRQSFPTMQWMYAQGVRFVPSWTHQAFKVDNKFRFWGGLCLQAVGGGKGLSDQLFEIAIERGVEIKYAHTAMKLEQDTSGKVAGVTVRNPGGIIKLESNAIVLACGGFEANPEMRARYLGPGWELAKVRGVRYNTGDGHRMAFEIGAQAYGHYSGCHAVAWDLNAPDFGNRSITDLYQKHSYPFGLIVNAHGERFVDEGADFRNYTYAKYGKQILFQPERVAYQIFDQKTLHLLRDEYRIEQVTKGEANTIEELAQQLDINQEGLVRTITEYNAACQPGEYNPTVLDGVRTHGASPEKSNWALPIDSPPYQAYAVTCGITFTFGGLKINERAQVMDTSDTPIHGLYAAGELVGGLFYHNYAGGAGLMQGSVFGKIAGTSAAEDLS